MLCTLYFNLKRHAQIFMSKIYKVLFPYILFMFLLPHLCSLGQTFLSDRRRKLKGPSFVQTAVQFRLPQSHALVAMPPSFPKRSTSLRLRVPALPAARPPCGTPLPLLGGLTRTRPSALGCRARLTPIHSSSRSSRQVFPQDIPRWFPGGRREKPVLGEGKTVCWLLFRGRSTPQMSATSSGGNKDAQQSVKSAPPPCMLGDSANAVFMARRS